MTTVSRRSILSSLAVTPLLAAMSTGHAAQDEPVPTVTGYCVNSVRQHVSVPIHLYLCTSNKLEMKFELSELSEVTMAAIRNGFGKMPAMEAVRLVMQEPGFRWGVVYDRQNKPSFV